MERALVSGLVASLVLGCGGAPRDEAPASDREGAAEPEAPAGAEASPAEASRVEVKVPGPSPESPPAPNADASPTLVAPEASPAAPPVAAEALAPALLEGPDAPSPWPASLETTVKVGASTLRVAAQTGLDGGKSRLWAQPLTDQDEPAGSAVELRTTNGELEALAAAFDGTTLWVGWLARLSEDGRGIQGLAGFDPALRPTIKTKGLRFFRYGGAATDEPLQLVARPGVGVGVTVVALAGSVRCEGMFFEEEGLTECVQLAIDLVGPDGSVELTETSELEGGDPSLTLTEGDEGLDVELLSWRGGALTDNVYVAYAGTVSRLSTCSFAPARLAWLDGGLLSICRDPELTEDEVTLACSPKQLAACGAFYFSRPPGATGSTTIPLGVETRFDRLTLGCKDGVPTLRVSWKGGSFDVPAEAVGLIGDDAVLEGGRCKGKALP